VPTRRTAHPAGMPTSRSPSTCAITAVTVAPRAIAVRARAKPWRPLLLLPRKRTSSQGSCVPPMLMTTCRPCRSERATRPLLAMASVVRAASAIARGSGSRPAPESEPVSRPSAGSRTTAPRSRSKRTFAWVAGCTHISVCMAGAITTRPRVVNNTLVSKSLAIPCDARARKSAVAGATITRSAR